jgi:Putative ABC exporter
MHPALFTLMRLQARSIFRRMLRGLQTPAGAIFTALGLLMCFMWLGPGVVASFISGRADPASVRRTAPLAILAFCLLSLRGSASGAGIYFTPSEVDFLFSGPFRRRELLAYKLLRATYSLAIVALFLSIGLLKFVTFWLAGYVGCYLSLMFITLFSMAMALLAQAVNERAYTRFRQVVLILFLLLLAVSLGRIFGGGMNNGLSGALQVVQDSWVGRCLIAPFAVFAMVLTSESLYPDLVQWSVIALGLNAALVVLILWLDADYLEASVATSQKIYERIQRVRRGQRGSGWAGRSTARWRLPQLPHWGGVGSVAWRQLTIALRQSPGFLLVLLFIAVGIAVAVRIGGLPESVVGIVPGFVVWLTFFFTNMLRFDFRGDVEHIDLLKSMPLRPSAIAIGELLTPVLVLSAIQLAVLSGLGAVSHDIWPRVGTAMAFAPLLNFFLFGVENLFFLLLPTRAMAVSPADFQSFGRQVVLMIGKMFIFGVSIGMAAIPGVLACWLSGWSLAVFFYTSWMVMLLEAALVVPLIVWAFGRFDVSADLPT